MCVTSQQELLLGYYVAKYITQTLLSQIEWEQTRIWKCHMILSVKNNEKMENI